VTNAAKGQPNERSVAVEEQGQQRAAVEEGSATEVTREAAEVRTEALTPEALARENRQGDRAIALLVVLFAFGLGFFTIADPNLWLHLKSGWWIHHFGIPRTDPFGFATQGEPWRNTSWLYDWALYQLEDLETRYQALRLAEAYERLLLKRSEPMDEEGFTVPAIPKEAQQLVRAAVGRLRDAAQHPDTTVIRWAAEELVRVANKADLRLPPTAEDRAALVTLRPFVAARALIWAAVAALLLTIRYPGPTLWWAAVCVGTGLLAMLRSSDSGPMNVSLLLLAAELAVLHQATRRNWAWLWLLVPMFALWANVHVMFVLGVLILWVGLLGEAMASRPGSEGEGELLQRAPLAWKEVLPPAVLATLATCLSPYGPLGWWDGLIWVVRVADREYLSAGSLYATFGMRHIPVTAEILWPPLLVAAALVVLASGSLWLPNVSLSWTRLALLVCSVAVGLLAVRMIPVTAMLATVVLSLNGQEWFLKRFGTEVRVTLPWVLWSRLGRAATVIGLFVVGFLSLSGRVPEVRPGRMGWGVEWWLYDLPLARQLRELGLQGQVLNTSPVQGNLLLWANYSLQRPWKVYFDGRAGFHWERVPDIYGFFGQLSRGRIQTKQLNDYRISAVALSRGWGHDKVPFTNTFLRLSDSSEWALVVVSPTAAVFARLDRDLPADLRSDAELAQQKRVDPKRLAFLERTAFIPELEPGPPPPIRAPSLVDRLWPQLRLAEHIASFQARHWLNLRRQAEGPAEYLLAMRAAREATAAAPTSPVAWTRYAEACAALLMRFELPIAREARAASGQAVDVHRVRILEVLAAYQQAISAAPHEYGLRLSLAELYESLVGYPDLAAEQYAAALELMPETDERRGEAERRFNLLQSLVDGMKRELEKPESRQISAALRAQIAAQNGFLRLAINALSEEYGPVGTGGFDSSLLSDYYLSAGLIAEAFDTLVEMGSATAGEAFPGLFEEKWGFVHLLRGDYRRAKRYWESSLAKQRHALAERKLQGFRDLLFGRIQQSIDTDFNLTTAIERQVAMEYQLGLLNLEMGEPDEAARHFHQSLKLAPNNPYRPLIAYYLKEITGESIPPTLTSPASTPISQGQPVATPTSASEAQPPAHQGNR
jgi:tetratricopeptide (TPR) repeat protein